MPETSSQQAAVALLYESADAAAHLSDGLSAAGVVIAYQAQTADFDRIALEESHAQVVLVNLDPSSEGDLDPIHALLDDPRYNVIFNESQTSAALEGWDQARWLRHLLAKIRGGSDADPPRPEDAEPIPDKATPPEDDATAQLQAAEFEEVEPEPAPEPAELPGDMGVELDALLDDAGSDDEDGLSLLATMDESPAQAVEVDTGSDLGLDLDLGLDDDPPELQEAEPAPASDEPDFDFDSLFGESDDSAAQEASSDGDDREAEPVEADGLSMGWPDDVEASVATAEQGVPTAADTTTADMADFDLDLDLDIDALSDATESASVPDTETQAAAQAVETTDTDADEDDWFEAAGQESAPHAAVDSQDTGEEFDLDLDDLDHLFNEGGADEVGDALDRAGDTVSAANVSVDTGDAVLGLDEDVLAALESETVEPVDITERSGIGLELAPLDDPSEERASPADFGIETMSAASFLAPAGDEAQTPAADELAQTFDFDLVPMEEAIAPRPVEETVSEFRLGPANVDLVAETARVSRVWVLVAAMGGPESIRDFLALMPADLDGLIVVAQDIGSEFLEVMQEQLAGATPLSVRKAVHGEILNHGEVVLVPSQQAFALGSDGKVTLSQRQSGTKMINTVLHMVADEFADAATAVVFSGMDNDAEDGVRYLHGRGGKVHAQSAETCVASGLPDGARATGVVERVGSPHELAQHLLDAVR